MNTFTLCAFVALLILLCIRWVLMCVHTDTLRTLPWWDTQSWENILEPINFILFPWIMMLDRDLDDAVRTVLQNPLIVLVSIVLSTFFSLLMVCLILTAVCCLLWKWLVERIRPPSRSHAVIVASV